MSDTKMDVKPAHSGECSDIRAVFSVVLSAIGMGVVMLPTVMARCGWIGGLVVLCGGCLVASFAVSKLYFSVANSTKQINTYEDLGGHCFGKPGRYFTGFIVHLTMSGICASLLLLLADNTFKLLPQVSKTLWAIIWALAMLPLCFLKSMHEVSYVAAFGMVSILILFVVIVINGIMTGAQTEDVEYDFFIFDILEIGTCFGTCILSFNVTNSVATLVRDMKHPTHFVKVSRWAYATIFVVYTGIGCSGYFGYGRELVHAPIMDSIVPPGEAVQGAWAYITVFAIICSSMPHYVVLLLPIASSFEYALGIDIHNPSRKTLLQRCASRVCVVALTTVIACVVPNVQSLLDILGSFTMVLMVAVMPCIFYWKTQSIMLGSLKTYVSQHKAEFAITIVILAWCGPMIIIGSVGAINNYGAA